MHDTRFGHSVHHSGGLPGYGSNSGGFPAAVSVYIALGNANLRADVGVARRMWRSYADHGPGPRATVAPSADLLKRREQVGTVLSSWTDGAANDLFADNVALTDRSTGGSGICMDAAHGALAMESWQRSPPMCGRIKCGTTDGTTWCWISSCHHTSPQESALREGRGVGIRPVWPYPKQVRSSSRMRSCVKFKKGDTVIYPQHGACIVQGTKKMEAFGATQEYLILRTVINEMTLSVPTLKTDEVGVRPPVNADELEYLVSASSRSRCPATVPAVKNHQNAEDWRSVPVRVVGTSRPQPRCVAVAAAAHVHRHTSLVVRLSPAFAVSAEYPKTSTSLGARCAEAPKESRRKLELSCRF